MDHCPLRLIEEIISQPHKPVNCIALGLDLELLKRSLKIAPRISME